MPCGWAPDDWEPLQLRALILNARYEEDRALAESKRALELAPRAATLWQMRGQIQDDRSFKDESRKDLARARELLDEQLRLDEENWGFLLLRAEVLKGLRQFGPALADCERVIKQAPRLAWGYLSAAGSTWPTRITIRPWPTPRNSSA